MPPPRHASSASTARGHAQAALETGWGTTTQRCNGASHNLFGIAGATWQAQASLPTPLNM
jgi:uncharacterized FlgJ-related protein